MATNLKVRVTEKAAQKAILDYLHVKKIVAWRSNSGTAQVKMGNKEYWMQLAPAGTPDIVGYWPDGRFLGIEIKGTGGVISKEQAGFIKNANNLGALCFVAYSIDDVANVMQDNGY